jgi:hypothetical protein
MPMAQTYYHKFEMFWKVENINMGKIEYTLLVLL